MITLDDCIGMSGLTEEEILAIAEHDHVPASVAAGLVQYMSRQPGGFSAIRDMIIDDVRAAQARGDRNHVRELLHVLHHYLRSHPEAEPDGHPWSSVSGSAGKRA